MFRRISLAVLAAFLAVPIALADGADVAHADDNLRLISTTTYTLDAETGVVHVVVDMSLRNQFACGGSVSYYYAGFSLPIPIGASPAVATTGGKSLQVTSERIADNDTFILLDVSFLSRLLCRATTQVIVTYDLLGSAPRTDNPSRVNAAYAAFPAFGVGDDVTVKVVVPPQYTSETFGDSVVETHENGNTIYTAASVENPGEFNFFVSATNNDALVTTDITTEQGVEFRLHAWPGDSEWQEFMTTQIEAGVPLLSDLIGQPWPINDPVDVRESYTPYLYGYAGWFSASTNELEIGEDLDQDTALHELSHAWFSNAWFSERWLVEGFAREFASQGVNELGGQGLQPLEIDSNDIGKVLLNEWGNPSLSTTDEEIDDVERYGYNASFFVVRQIVRETGLDRLREVLDAVANDKTAYRGDVAPETSASVTDWRRFLDLVEEIGGATTAGELLEKYAVTTAESALLAERAPTRERYKKLVDTGGEWAAPVAVREQMAEWNFTKATDLIVAANAVLDLRDELDTKAADLRITYPSNLEEIYESADDSLAESRAALQQQIDAADALLAAVNAEERDDGVFERIGLIGSDPGETLDDARAAFAAGDNDLAIDLAQDVSDQITEAPGKGKMRAILAGVALLLIGLATLFLIRRRRHRKQGQLMTSSPQEFD